MSPAANGKATSPGPMAQTPLLHTKFVVSITGTEVVALAGATKPNPVATSHQQHLDLRSHDVLPSFRRPGDGTDR
jgi:hypothetical protein